MPKSFIDMYMRLFVIETDHYFGQLYSWTQKIMEAKTRKDLGCIVNTFEEVEKENVKQ